MCMIEKVYQQIAVAIWYIALMIQMVIYAHMLTILYMANIYIYISYYYSGFQVDEQLPKTAWNI